MEPIEIRTPETEILGSEKPKEKSKPIELCRTSNEQRNKHLQELFKAELGRELTIDELNEYLSLYKREKTNFWKFLDFIKSKKLECTGNDGGSISDPSASVCSGNEATNR